MKQGNDGAPASPTAMAKYSSTRSQYSPIGGLPKSMQRLLTPKEVADLLRVGVDCLAKWRWTGGGPPFVRISHNRVGYRVSDLDAWIASRTQRSTTQEGA